MNVLLSLRVENVRSFRDEAEFSLVASNLADEHVVRTVELNGSRPLGVLPVAGVFGPNASGKTTLLRALNDLRNLVVSSFRLGTPDSGIPRRPFLLDARCKQAPSAFHIEIVLDNTRWQYGVEVDDERVTEEYAYHFPNGRQALVFERQGQEVKFGAPLTSVGRALEPLMRANSLLLSAAGVAAENPLTALFGWFSRNLLLADSSTRGVRAAITADLLEDESTRARALGLLRAADLGISGMQRIAPDPELVARIEVAINALDSGDLAEDASPASTVVVGDFLRMEHEGPEGPVAFGDDDESLGTVVWAGLIGPIINVLDGGHVLLADELDASLHPYLVRAIIRLFQRPDTNPHAAQLIFNAHDVTVLGDSEPSQDIGRDQVWFSSKGTDGSTSLTPLSDFSPRKDEALERRYLQGRFGAVPIISDAEFEAALTEPVDTLA